MKLLHFSDLHIGVENYGRPDPDTGLSTRLLDFLAAYDELVDYAIAARVDAVLFAGDAYKSRDPSQTHQREFARRIARLAAEGIPVFLVTGNHDLPAIAGRASALDIFPTLAIERVFVSDHISTTILPTRAGPLQIVALPWVRRSQFLTRDDTRNLTLDQITQRLQERLTNALTWELQRLDPNLPAVLVGHVTVSGATVGTERSMMLGRDHVLLLSTLASPALDYVALGHVHKHQVLGYNPTVAYSGSLQRVDFSEEAEDKGFCVIDLDEKQPAGSRLRRFDFHPVKARPFLTIDVEVQPGDDDPTRRVLDAIARKYVTDAIVRVRIQLPEEVESRLRDADIRDALSG
ncbi:MAG: exonuclease SbcCD subunit D, partial [Dehalococcoidia bacterium]|nr:exonuclease SbcCD subunit D [Dehalococcoidia bacterium]